MRPIYVTVTYASKSAISVGHVILEITNATHDISRDVLGAVLVEIRT